MDTLGDCNCTQVEHAFYVEGICEYAGRPGFNPEACPSAKFYRMCWHWWYDTWASSPVIGHDYQGFGGVYELFPEPVSPDASAHVFKYIPFVEGYYLGQELYYHNYSPCPYVGPMDPGYQTPEQIHSYIRATEFNNKFRNFIARRAGKTPAAVNYVPVGNLNDLPDVVNSGLVHDNFQSDLTVPTTLHDHYLTQTIYYEFMDADGTLNGDTATVGLSWNPYNNKMTRTEEHPASLQNLTARGYSTQYADMIAANGRILYDGYLQTVTQSTITETTLVIDRAEVGINIFAGFTCPARVTISLSNQHLYSDYTTNLSAIRSAVTGFTPEPEDIPTGHEDDPDWVYEFRLSFNDDGTIKVNHDVTWKYDWFGDSPSSPPQDFRNDYPVCDIEMVWFNNRDIDAYAALKNQDVILGAPYDPDVGIDPLYIPFRNDGNGFMTAKGFVSAFHVKQKTLHDEETTWYQKEYSYPYNTYLAFEGIFTKDPSGRRPWMPYECFEDESKSWGYHEVWGTNAEGCTPAGGWSDNPIHPAITVTGSITPGTTGWLNIQPESSKVKWYCPDDSTDYTTRRVLIPVLPANYV